MSNLRYVVLFVINLSCVSADEKANALFVEAMASLDAIQEARTRGEFVQAKEKFEKAKANIKEIILNYPTSQIAVKIVSNEIHREGFSIQDYFNQVDKKAKLEEIYENLDICYKGVVDYFELGTTPPGKMPPSTPRACPNGLDYPPSDSGFIPSSFFKIGSAFRSINWAITDAVFGCYQYEASTGSKAGGAAFNCNAWTDFDGNGSVAFWQKRATWQSVSSTFSAGHVWHDNESDDW
jgi:hypothetical protein